MKKYYLYIAIFLFTTVTGKIFAQKEITWQDSAPFPKTIVQQGVQKDSLITLTPIWEEDGNDIQLENFTLGGFDWTWPDETIPLGAVEDIDVRTIDDQDLYLVTDPLRSGSKVFIYNPVTKRITWEYTGGELVLPVDAFEFLENEQYRVLITDRGSHRVLQIGRETQSIDWDYGDPNGLEGNGPNQLSNPADAVKIDDSTEFLIADRGNDRVIIVEKSNKSIVWELGSAVLSSPVDIEYIQGDQDLVLITDQGHNRVLLVSRASKEIVWQYPSEAMADDATYGLLNPVDADMIENGHVLIADAGNNRIVEVDPQNTDYFWELKLELQALKDVDQIGSQSSDSEKLLIVHRDDDANKIIPARIGFESGWRESDLYVLDKDVNFDSLFWDAETNSGDNTSLEMQFRSGTDVNHIQRQDWIGPSGDSTTTYTSSGMRLFLDKHKAHSVYQYRAFLQTDTPKDTPVLKGVSVKYHYYDTNVNVTPKPYFWASTIGVSDADSLIPNWKTFECELDLPDNAVQRSAIDLLFRIIENTSPYRTLYEFSANTDESVNTVNLENIPALLGITSINLNAYPSTKNSAITPALVRWKLVYEEVQATTSSIRFVDTEGEKTYGYLASNTEPDDDQTMDQALIRLDDNNLESIRQSFDVPVTACISGDSEMVTLDLKQSFFQNSEGIPIIISSTFTPGNDTLEVVDRDTLAVIYQDVNDMTDVSMDSVLVVLATNGNMTIENNQGVSLSQVEFDQVIFVRITDEMDKNLNPITQDSLEVTLKNTALDREDIYLYEIPDNQGIYNTGNFINREGILITDNTNGIDINDGILQSSFGGSIQAEYIDNVILTRSVLVPSEPNVLIDLGGEPYVVEVAPNPYFEYSATNFRMRVASATGSLIVRKVEVYSLAGEKVKEIDGNSLSFDTGSTVPKEKYGVVDYWWDLYNDSGHKVSSGTYWLKVHADLITDESGQSEQIAIFRKFMVVR